MVNISSKHQYFMDTISQSEDPPGPSSRSPLWMNLLAGMIASVTLAVPLYITLEFSSVETPQALPTRTAQHNP